MGKLAKINGIDDLDDFLYPKENALHDPYLLGNIVLAKQVIVDAIVNKKYISIHSDNDQDGANSCAIMYNYLKNFTDHLEYFYVQREKGHGIEMALDIIPDQTELLIIVDSSTSSRDACKEITDRGIQIVILDHHEASCKNEFAIIVNPQLDAYPNKYISGAGVVWKMCQVLDDEFNTKHSKHFIDLAGIGIYGDAMSMLEKENRFIVHKALTNINNFGIKAILKAAKKESAELTTTDIGFTIAPMLNGASRMGKIEDVLEILTCCDERRCAKLAKQLVELNEQRKDIQAKFIEKFTPLIREEDSIIVIIDEKIGKNFAGLVAGDISNQFNRPVLVLSPVGDQLHGSFRAQEDFKLRSFLLTCPQIILAAGHESAGGVRLPKRDLDDFISYADRELQKESFANNKEYDIEIDLADIDELLIKKVQLFNRITGNRIKPARFKVNGVFVSDKQLIGKKKNTVKLLCGDIDILKFRTNEEFFENAPVFSEIAAIGSLNLNVWEYYDRNKRRKVKQITKQLFLEDYQICP